MKHLENTFRLKQLINLFPRKLITVLIWIPERGNDNSVSSAEQMLLTWESVLLPREKASTWVIATCWPTNPSRDAERERGKKTPCKQATTPVTSLSTRNKTVKKMENIPNRSWMSVNGTTWGDRPTALIEKRERKKKKSMNGEVDRFVPEVCVCVYVWERVCVNWRCGGLKLSQEACRAISAAYNKTQSTFN